MTMSKFCCENVQLIVETDSLIISEVTLKDFILNEGFQIGMWKGIFLIKSNPYVKQMISGIRTEEGITKKSVLILKQGKYNIQASSEVNHRDYF